MSIYRTIYHFYGISLTDDADYFALEEDIGQCVNNDEVGVFRAGAYNRHKTYLALWWEKKEAGEPVFHSGVQPVAPKFERDRWNDDINAVVDQLGLETIGEPGWYTIGHEG